MGYMETAVSSETTLRFCKTEVDTCKKTEIFIICYGLLLFKDVLQPTSKERAVVSNLRWVELYLSMQLLLHVLAPRRVDVPHVLPIQLDPAPANERVPCLHPPQRLLSARREVGRRNLG